MATPVVFISYSHDSAEHKDWVLRLAMELRTRGVDIILDQWDLALGQDMASFMEAAIAKADRVLLICSEKYVEKADGRLGGVGYESLVVTGELVSRIDTKKFIPVIRQATGANKRVPHYLGSRLYIDFSSDDIFANAIEELARELHGAPRAKKPPLGPNPFAATPPTLEVQRVIGSSGYTSAGQSVVSDAWFDGHADRARRGLQSIDRVGSMEVRAGLHQPASKSQLELLNAVRNAEIKTFGWPIGILVESREEFRPRPVADGIVAEIMTEGKGMSGAPSYDLWAARTTGDFFLQHSLFEDERGNQLVFFNTRIVRVAETFLFLAGFYESLGLPPRADVTVRIAHTGLKGRTLASAGPTRHLRPRTTTAESSESQIVTTVGGLREDTAENVRRVLAPMFMLFEFAEFDPSIYNDIVEQFRAGHVT